MTKRSQASQRAGFSPRVMQEVNEMQVMLGFVAAGLGIALISASVKQFPRPGVVYRELQPSTPEVARFSSLAAK